MQCSISETVNARAFKPLPFCSAPRKLTSRDFWGSRNERKPLSKQTCVLRKCYWVSQKQWMLQLSNLCHSVQHPENWLVGISGALGMKESHFLSKHVFWENAIGYHRNSECYSFQTFAIVFSTPENWVVGISGAPGMKVSHFLSKNVFWENAVGYLRNGEC